MPKIFVRDISSAQILMEVDLEEGEKAYSYAAELEEIGLSVEVINPTLTESLLHSLGATEIQKKSYLTSLDEELESHETPSCAHC